MLITLKADIHPPTAPVLGTPSALSTTSLSVPLSVAATDLVAVASYQLELATSAGGTYSVISAAAAFPYLVTGLTAATSYFYRASATDTSGNVGNYSAIVSGTTNSSGVGDPLIPRDATTGDIFVDLDRVTNGSGTLGTPYQQSQATQAVWRSLVAGQQMVFLNASGTGTYTPFDLTSLPSGSSGNRIVVRTYQGHTQANFVFPTTGACLLGGNYWRFYNLKFTCIESGWLMGNAGNGFYGSDSRSGTTLNTDFVDCTGTKGSGGITDNSAIIAASGYGPSGNYAAGIDVLRCTFSGANTGATNRSLIWFDDVKICSVVGCLLTSGDNSIYFKHSYFTAGSGGINILVANNIFLGPTGRGGFVASINSAVIRNNAIQGNSSGGSNFYFDEDGGSTVTSDNNTISHNTIVNASWFYQNLSLASSRMLSNTLLNNVMIGASARYSDAPFSTNDGGNVIDYSACDTGTHYQRNHSVFTMASYHSTYPTQESHGVSGTISLVGGTTPGAMPANWALTGGSVGIGNASDGGNRGVDATKLLTVN